jgi:hypothetical protein
MSQWLRGQDQAEFADMVDKIGAGLRKAGTRGEPFYIQPNEGAPAPAPPPTDFAAPVYVITPGRCASACLDALDIFTRFPNVRLIGAPTSGDTTYMETRSADLPSGHGRIVVPVKLWAGRPRGTGEYYSPHIPVNDLDWSTVTFLDRIETDLRAS